MFRVLKPNGTRLATGSRSLSGNARRLARSRRSASGSRRPRSPIAPSSGGVDRHGRVAAQGLHRDSIAPIFKTAESRAVMNATNIAGHSVRVGMATMAAFNGSRNAPSRELQVTGCCSEIGSGPLVLRYTLAMRVKSILEQIDAEIARLRQVRNLLTTSATFDGTTDRATKGKSSDPQPKGAKKRRKLSAEARAKIAAAQKRRWAAQKAKA